MDEVVRCAELIPLSSALMLLEIYTEISQEHL